jgi:hypothetical protein
MQAAQVIAKALNKIPKKVARQVDGKTLKLLIN